MLCSFECDKICRIRRACVRIWIWWKCWIINLSFNSPKSLLNFVNLLKFPNLLNIKSFIIRFKKKKRELARESELMWDKPDFLARIFNVGRAKYRVGINNGGTYVWQEGAVAPPTFFFLYFLYIYFKNIFIYLYIIYIIYII